jgi:hypothetical protein
VDKSHFWTRLHASLRALGDDEMPSRLVADGDEYVHCETLKHTFFSATGIYDGPRGKAVFKFGRSIGLLGIPLRWIGRWLTRRELRIYRMVDDLHGVPRCLGASGEFGFGHEFVEGHPMRRRERTGAAFFDELQQLLDEVHRRQIAYVDLSKPENILVGDDGRPHLIDFGIAWSWPEREERRGPKRWIPNRLGRFVLDELQTADRFHLIKHWMRASPETLTEEQRALIERRSGWIRFHRVFRKPYRRIRRKILDRIGRSAGR